MKKLLLIALVAIVLFGCKKDEAPGKAEITVTDIDGNVYKTVTIGMDLQTFTGQKVKLHS